MLHKLPLLPRRHFSGWRHLFPGPRSLPPLAALVVTTLLLGCAAATAPQPAPVTSSASGSAAAPAANAPAAAPLPATAPAANDSPSAAAGSDTGASGASPAAGEAPSSAAGSASPAMSPPADSPPVGIDVGNRVPDFSLRLIDGGAVTSEQLVTEGRPTFLFFWATW